MSRNSKLVANVVVACGAVLAMLGCGSASSSENTGTQSMRLQGSIPSSARRLDNARVIAVGSNGKRFWTYVDAAGKFTLTVPSGVSYRVLVTNAQRIGPDRVTAHLAVTTTSGVSQWLGIHGGGTIDLGQLSSSGAAATIHTMSEGEPTSDGESDHTEHAEGGETHEGDDDEGGGACSDHDGKDDADSTEDDDDIELKAERDPGERCHDDLDREHHDDKEDEGEKDDDAPCAAGGGGGAAPAPAPGPASAPASAPAAAPAPAPAPAPGTVQLGGACHVSADCSGLLICAASVCSTVVVR